MDVAKVEAVIKNDLSWLQRHERLCLAVIAGLVLWFAIGKIDTLIVHHDAALLSQAQVVAKTQQDKNDALAQQVATDKAAFDTLNAQVQARDAQLLQLQAQLVATLAQRQKTDASLPPSELVNRWATLVPLAKPTVTPTGVAMDTPSAVATVQQLEIIPVQQQEINNAQEELDNANKLVTAGVTRVSDLTAQVTGLQAKAVDDAKVCTEQIATVKATARKSKLHWFEAGYVAGLVTRGVITLLTGH